MTWNQNKHKRLRSESNRRVTAEAALLRVHRNTGCLLAPALWVCVSTGGNWWEWWQSCRNRTFLDRSCYHTVNQPQSFFKLLFKKHLDKDNITDWHGMGVWVCTSASAWGFASLIRVIKLASVNRLMLSSQQRAQCYLLSQLLKTSNSRISTVLCLTDSSLSWQMYTLTIVDSRKPISYADFLVFTTSRWRLDLSKNLWKVKQKSCCLVN